MNEEKGSIVDQANAWLENLNDLDTIDGRKFNYIFSPAEIDDIFDRVEEDTADKLYSLIECIDLFHSPFSLIKGTDKEELLHFWLQDLRTKASEYSNAIKNIAEPDEETVRYWKECRVILRKLEAIRDIDYDEWGEPDNEIPYSFYWEAVRGKNCYQSLNYFGQKAFSNVIGL